MQKFIWTKVHDRTFRKVDHSNQLEFVMAEQNEGKYQCQCENDYGSSEVSEPVELTFLNSSSASTFCMVLISQFASDFYFGLLSQL